MSDVIFPQLSMSEEELQNEIRKEHVMKTTRIITAMVSSFSLLLAPVALAQSGAQEARQRIVEAEDEAMEVPSSPGSPAIPKATPPGEPERGTREPATQLPTPSSSSRPAQQGIFLSSKDLVGATVKNPQGEELGEIEELLIDPQSGRISVAVLSVGGVLGVGAKRVAISWGTIGKGVGGEELVAALSKEQIQNAPSFEEANPQSAPTRR